MFSKTVVLLFVLTNVFYANCRPQAEPALLGNQNVPQLNEDQIKNIFGNPAFSSYLQQLAGYFSTLQTQQQGESSSQVLQSQQSSSQTSSQESTSAAQRSDQQETIISSGAAQQTPIALSAQQLGVGQAQAVAEIQTSSVSQSRESSAQSQSSKSSQSTVVQGVNSQNIPQLPSVFQPNQVIPSAQVDQTSFQQNPDNPTSNQIANLLHNQEVLEREKRTFQGAQSLQSSFAGSQASGSQQTSEAQLAQNNLQQSFNQFQQSQTVQNKVEEASQSSQQQFQQNTSNQRTQQLAGSQVSGSQQTSEAQLAQNKLQQSFNQFQQSQTVQKKVEEASQSSQQQFQQNTQQSQSVQANSQTNTQSQFAQNTSDQRVQQQNAVSGAYQNQQNSQQSQAIQNTLQQHFSQNINKNTNQYDASQGANNVQQSTIYLQGKPITQEGVYDPALEKIQAQNAHYKFATLLDDNIEGNFQLREEARQAGKVVGRYAYDDGAIMRTVIYEADDKGFRVLKDEIFPSAKYGARLDGTAIVKTFMDGNTLDYAITKADIQNTKPLVQNVNNLI